MAGYAFAGAGDEPERGRLELLERCADPLTIEQLTAVPVTAGWHCLDVGAGAGSVSRWLAARVGADGRVVAADLNPRFLADVPDNVEVRPLDITANELDAGTYDLVHSRLLLMHLEDPAAALARMTAALKPGGWLVVTEADWGLVAFGGHPDAAWATRYLHELFALHGPAGLRRPYFGRELPGLVLALGLEEVAGDTEGPMGLPDSDALALYRATIDGLRPANRTVGATDADLDRLAAVIDSPTISCSAVTLVAMRGRRPRR